MRSATKLLVCFLSLIGGWQQSALALSPVQIDEQLDQVLSVGLSVAPTMNPLHVAEPGRTRLLGLLSKDPRVAQAGVLTRELVLQVVHDDFVRHRVTIDEARSLVSHYAYRQLPVSPKDVGYLTQLLLPYARDAGLCHGDPFSNDGATCAFGFAPNVPGVKVSGSFEVANGEKKELHVAKPGTVLNQVLAGCALGDTACFDLASPLLLPAVTLTERHPTWDSFRELVERTLSKNSANVILSLLGIGEADASITISRGEEWTSGQDDRTQDVMGAKVRIYGPWGQYVRYRCAISASLSGVHTWCDIVGEHYGASNIQYLVAGSDSLFVLVPFALHCDGTCFWSGIGHAIQDAAPTWLNGDANSFMESMSDYIAANADPAYYLLRNAGSFAIHQVRGGCGIVPGPAQSRLPHRALVAGDANQMLGDKELDLSPHTNYQMPPSDPTVSGLSTNMDPVPTTAVANLPTFAGCQVLPIRFDFLWSYNFLAEVAWNINVMFSGLDDYDVANSCPGDQVWIWHGEGAGCETCLRTIDWRAEFSGGHLPMIPTE